MRCTLGLGQREGEQADRSHRHVAIKQETSEMTHLLLVISILVYCVMKSAP